MKSHRMKAGIGKSHGWLPPSVAAIAIAATSATHAQNVLVEIVVTAQRREQVLDDVGLSISAFSAEQMQALGFTKATDVAAFSPGVVMESTAGTGLNATLTVRGVAATDFSPNQESPNAIYVDDIYIASSYAANFVLYDLERIEILRGPQGTLFGRNSTGGLANFITKKASSAFEGYVSATYGSYDQTRLEGAMGGSISERVRGRISGVADYADGWWKNRLGHDTMEQKFWGFRGQLEGDVSDSLQAYLSVSYDKNPRARNGTYESEPVYVDPATGRLAPLPRDVDAYGTGPGNDFFGYRDPDSKKRVSAFNDYGFLQKEKVSPTLRLSWDLGDGLTATSLSNYTQFSYDYREDCDSTPGESCDYPAGQDLDQWSQELRLSRTSAAFNWTAGLYYLNIKQDNYQYFDSPDYAFSIANLFDQDVESISAFGQFDYLLTDKIRFTLGARILRDTKTFSSVSSFSLLEGVTYDPPLVVYDFSRDTVGALARQEKWNWSGRVQLDYIASDDALTYISVSRGVKGSGFNTNVGAALALEETPFKGEIVYAYEAGTKLKLFDQNLRVNSSVFYYDYNDFQAFQFQGVQSFVTNNDASMYGAETELAATPMAGLDVLLGVSYLKSKIEDVRTFSGAIRDQQALNAPRWTMSGLIRKGFEVGAGDLALQYSFNYASKRYSSVDNNYTSEMNPATIHNARISYDLKDSGIEVAAFCNNFTDKAKVTGAFDYSTFLGTRIAVYNPPRWFGLEVRKNF